MTTVKGFPGKEHIAVRQARRMVKEMAETEHEKRNIDITHHHAARLDMFVLAGIKVEARRRN